jgi:hypothetical protein
MSAPNRGGASGKAKPGNDQWRLDPGDVHRYARRKRQGQSPSALAKVVRYGFLALTLLGAFAVYWNFETLRGLSVDFSKLASLIEERSGIDVSAVTGLRSQQEPVVVEPAGVVGAEIETSIKGAEPPAAAETPSAPAVAAPVAAAAPAEPLADAAPVAAPAPPAADEVPAVAAVAPPPAPPPEPPPGPESFEFGLPVVTVSEADASAAVIILRNGDRRRASSVTWSTSDGTAAAGTDYANLGPLIERFAAGEQNRTIRIPIVGDRNPEGPETFYVHLIQTEGASAVTEERLEVIINDDD